MAADPMPTAVPIHTPRPAVFRAAVARSGFASVACSGAPASGASLSDLVMVNRLMQQGRAGEKIAVRYQFNNRATSAALLPIPASLVMPPGRPIHPRPR